MSLLWQSKFAEALVRLETCMTTASGFSALLADAIATQGSPISAMSLQVEASAAKPILIGNQGAGDPDHLATIPIKGSRHTRAKLQLWFHDTEEAGNQTIVDKTVVMMRQAFEAWWTPDARSPKGDLPMWTDATKRRGRGALELSRQNSLPFTVIFCDLDNFKAVNKELGQAGGDAVISRMATFFEEVVADQAIAVHHGGDEFVIVMPGGADHDAAELAARIIIEADAYDFGAKEVPVGLSLGIASSTGYPDANFEDLVKVSDEEALKKLVKADTDTKGSVRISSLSAEIKRNADIDQRIISLVLRCSLAGRKQAPPFSSPWLNAIVIAGRRTWRNTKDLKALEDSVKGVLKAFRIPLSDTDISYYPSSRGMIVEPTLSGTDIAAAFAFVVLEACLYGGVLDDGQVLVIKQETTSTCLFAGEQLLFRIEAPSCREYEIIIGSPWRAEEIDGECAALDLVNSSPFILMEIGRINLDMLCDLAADHMVIDDRPVRGGGLPDFWELSLSRLISSLGRFPNVEQLILVGDANNALETVERIKDVKNWDLDYISYKTAVHKGLVKDAQRRIEGKVAHYETESEALRTLLDAKFSPKVLRGMVPQQDVEPRTLLQRTLDFPKAALGPSDGCRVRTAAEAFPLTLELIRSINEDDELIIDQDGIRIRELVDFKVVVQDAEHEQVPWFFREERERLERYFRHQFLEREGRFAEKFLVSGHEERILDHVHWALTRSDGKPFATRRAVLVIPHEPAPTPANVSPLGLISVRILPRPMPNEVIINFSYTWRTVEALIGFPYSLYGSLRYSQHLCEEISKRCVNQRIKMGCVSYVAHSLHFFVNDESRRIARRIVSESST